MTIFDYLRELWRGKDLYRIFMNRACLRHQLHGRVLDVGSGLKLASYHRFLKSGAGVELECLDLGFEDVGGKKINLEKDFLPQATESVDTVLMFNVLEHLYNYALPLSEVNRVLTPKGELLGAVPFLVAYHPDPHDYWRYSQEALEKIFMAAGFKKITITPFGGGPAVAAFSQLEIILPRILKILLMPVVCGLDWMIIKLRPQLNKEKFSLGLFFSVSK